MKIIIGMCALLLIVAAVAYGISAERDDADGRQGKQSDDCPAREKYGAYCATDLVDATP